MHLICIETRTVNRIGGESQAPGSLQVAVPGFAVHYRYNEAPRRAGTKIRPLLV